MLWPKALNGSAWPSYDDFVDCLGGSEAKVDAEIVLRKIAASAADFLNLCAASGSNLN